MNWYKEAQVPENSEPVKVDQDIICPFCKEGDFDLIGLKGHLMHGDCEVWNEVKVDFSRRIF